MHTLIPTYLSDYNLMLTGAQSYAVYYTIPFDWRLGHLVFKSYKFVLGFEINQKRCQFVFQKYQN